MLVLGSRLHGTPVMSLQTGGRLARVAQPLIDPRNLKITAYSLEGPALEEHPSFLLTDDIREMSGMGMIVDSSDEFIGLDDVIKIKQLHDLGFSLIGMNVVDDHKHKLGKVEDYTVETGSFVIQQLNVKRGILRAIADTGQLVHRSQIKEITDRTIIVKSTAKKLLDPVKEAVRHEYVNPFRSPSPTPEPEA